MTTLKDPVIIKMPSLKDPVIIIYLFFSPEAFGVVTGCVFLITLFLFIPIPFGHFFFDRTHANFPHHEVM